VSYVFGVCFISGECLDDIVTMLFLRLCISQLKHTKARGRYIPGKNNTFPKSLVLSKSQALRNIVDFFADKLCCCNLNHLEIHSGFVLHCAMK